MALGAPYDLDADTNGTTDTITVTWTLGDTYAYVNIEHKQGGGSWSFEGQVTGSATTWDHEGGTSNVLHYYRAQGVSGEADPEFSPYSNVDSAAFWADTVTDEIITSESIDEYATGATPSDTITDTMYVSDFAVDAKEIITNYAYYVATADGKVYEYSDFYKSDAGTAIPANWESKDTDFADQNIEWADRFKTVEKVRLHYIDKSAGARVSIKVSTDGGASWTTKTRNIGTGDTKGKTADFFLIKTGQIFRFAIENDSATDDFQFVGLEVFYSVGGDYFEI